MTGRVTQVSDEGARILGDDGLEYFAPGARLVAESAVSFTPGPEHKALDVTALSPHRSTMTPHQQPCPEAVVGRTVQVERLQYLYTPTPHFEHVDIPLGPATPEWELAEPAPDVLSVELSGQTMRVSAAAVGEYELKVVSRKPDTPMRVFTFVAYRVEIEAPSGDPSDPATGGVEGQNEFTFSSAEPGVLTISCRARVVPDHPGARRRADLRARWSVQKIGSSTLTWNPDEKGRGRGVEATVSCTGLPQESSDFGRKRVRLDIGARKGQKRHSLSTDIEVFWPKHAVNHPPDGSKLRHDIDSDGRSPNWLYYWAQAVRQHDDDVGRHIQLHCLLLGSGSPGVWGKTDAHKVWYYQGPPPDKNRINVFPAAAERMPPVDLVDGRRVHGDLTGIDCFYNTVVHELVHVKQARDADALIARQMVPGTCFANGWSFNRHPHNHWELGPGRAPVPEVCAEPDNLGEKHGDQLLSYVDGDGAEVNGWPRAWKLPPPLAPDGTYVGGHVFEQVAYLAEVSPEHGLARLDWGSPGKNHGHDDQWDD